MKLYSFFLFIIIYELTPALSAQKSSYESKFQSRPFNSPNHDEQSDVEYSRDLKEKLAGNDYPKNKFQFNDLEDQPLYDKEKGLKRNAINNNYGRGFDRIYKRAIRPQTFRGDEGYGIVYGNGRPVGILEPYPQAFEFEPWMNQKEAPGDTQPQQLIRSRQPYADDYKQIGRIVRQMNADSENSESDAEDPAKFTNERFPSIYNDFKINSEMYKRNNQPIRRASGDNNLNLEASAYENNRLPADKGFQNLAEHAKTENLNELGDVKLHQMKRSGSSITDDQVEQLKTTLSRIQNPGPSDSVEEIERSLRSILSDMGLVSEDEKELQKDKRHVDNVLDARKVDKEDENLEEGANKIELVQNPVLPIDRNKRDNNKNEVKQDGGSSDTPLFKNVEPKVKEENFLEDIVKLDSPEVSNRVKKNSDVVKVANYKNEGETFIRSKRQDGKAETNDLMKGLEKSGDLTVSGNKSPLASSESEVEIQEKRDKVTTSHTAAINKREQDELEYQKHVEQIIQAKIDAIKEQVKREIDAINSMDGTTKCPDSQRRKRDVSYTLVDGETRDLDPRRDPDQKLVPLVRRRRYLDELPNLKRIKRGLLDFSNLKNIDSGDYLELEPENREQRRAFPDYQYDPQENKMLPENVKENPKLATNARAAIMNDLSGNENELLNVNSQDDASMQGEPLKIKVRSVTESDLPVGTIVVSSVTSPQEMIQKVENLSPEHQEVSISGGNKENGNLVLDNHSLQDSSRIEDELLSSEHEHALNDKRNADNAPLSEDQKLFENQNIEKKVENLSSSDNGAQKSLVDSAFEQKDENLLKKSVAIDPSKETENQNPEAKREVTPEKIKKSEGSVGEKADSKEKEENRIARKRREAEEEIMRQPIPKFRRIKRANDLMPGENVAYFPYRSENIEADDEGDEFDDDSIDDRTMEKRQAIFDPNGNAKFRRSVDYDNADEYVSPEEFSNYRAQRKRSAPEQYEAYENPSYNFLYQPQSYVRRKRQDLENAAAFHNGGAGMLHHIAAIRDRNVQFQENERNKRTFKHSKPKLAPKDVQNNIADFSGEDLFGALPQNYDGELSRFKRVKRNADEHLDMEKG